MAADQAKIHFSTLKSVKCFTFTGTHPGQCIAIESTKNKSAAYTMKLYHHTPIKTDIHGTTCEKRHKTKDR